MLTYNGALARILRATPAPRPARIPLAEALGLLLARPVIARVHLPGFDNTAVDGYALGDTARSAFNVVGTAVAGRPWRGRLRPGDAARVLTGARLPRGTRAVAMQERTTFRGGELVLTEPVTLGRNIRRRGEDVVRGASVLPAGTAIRAHELGLLAALGESSVRVWPRPKVSAVACGDELVQPGRRLRAGQIFEANGTLLSGLVRESGAELAGCAVVADRMEVLERAIRAGLAGSDVLVMCGGVSVGDRDFVKTAVARCGVTKVFWRVSIKPGMPLFFGTKGRTLVFGLPGNPVSVFVTWNEFVRPALDRLLGRPGGDPYRIPAVLGAPLTVSRGRRTHFVRITCLKRDGRIIATPVAAQGSHHLGSLAHADGWIRVDSSRGPLASGTVVEIRQEVTSSC